MTIINAAQTIEACGTIQDLENSLAKTLEEFGFNYFIYITVEQDRSAPYIMHNMGDAYKSSSNIDDPFLDYCCNSYAPMCTGPEFMNDYDFMTEEDKQFVRDAAKKSGFISGVSVPVKLSGSSRFGGFNFGTRLSRSDFLKKMEPHFGDISLFSLLVHRRIEELTLVPEDKENDFRSRKISDPTNVIKTLSPREKEILLLLAKGFSRKETAKLCNISHHTVADYQKTLYGKIGVNNKVDATRVAMNIGLVT